MRRQIPKTKFYNSFCLNFFTEPVGGYPKGIPVPKPIVLIDPDGSSF